MSEIINVLSIDMDWICEPCINLYNDLCKLDNPQKVWDNINRLRQIDKHLSFNENHLEYLFDIFTKKLMCMKDKTKVTFADNHDAILFELTKPDYYGKKFNIYNIDHHHDIYYNDQQAIDVDKYDFCSVNNWVWYLDKYKLIDTYCWIKNHNSFEHTGNNLIGRFISTSNPKQTNLDRDKIDYIFICKSPQWFPRNYDIYFNMLIKIYENITQNKVIVEKRNFCEGNQSKPYPNIG